MVRLAKGKKDRLIPIGERALLWVEKYVTEVRPGLVLELDSGVMFLTGEGQQLDPRHLSHVVTGYVDSADLGKKGSCHLFRHTMATLMLEGGADTRFIQQMLGHESLESTQLYTQVSIRKLQDIYLATHPAAKLKPKGEAVEEPADEDRAELLAQLDVEADEDGDEKV
jgi:integrase/recombinase XerD